MVCSVHMCYVVSAVSLMRVIEHASVLMLR